MKFNLLILTNLLLALPVNAAWWAPILSCDNGAARVEVDLGERRNVQIVVANKEIREYLKNAGVNFFYSSDVVPGSVDHGIFNSSQFSGFKTQGFSPTCHSGFSPTIKVFRVGSGLKFTTEQEFGEGCCWDMDSAGHCTNKGPDIPWRFMGDWYFQNCQEIPLAT